MKQVEQNDPSSQLKATLEEIRIRQQYILNCRNRPVSKNLINAITNASILPLDQPLPSYTSRDISTCIAGNDNPFFHPRFHCPLCNHNLLLDHYPKCTRAKGGKPKSSINKPQAILPKLPEFTRSPLNAFFLPSSYQASNVSLNSTSGNVPQSQARKIIHDNPSSFKNLMEASNHPPSNIETQAPTRSNPNFQKTLGSHPTLPSHPTQAFHPTKASNLTTEASHPIHPLTRILKQKILSTVTKSSTNNLKQKTPQKTVQSRDTAMSQNEKIEKKVSPIIIRLNKLKEKRLRHCMKKYEKIEATAVIKKMKRKKRGRLSIEGKKSKENINPQHVQRESVIKKRKHYEPSNPYTYDVNNIENDPIVDIDLTSLTSTASENEDEWYKMEIENPKVEKLPSSIHERNGGEDDTKTFSDVLTSQSNDVTKAWKINEEIEKGISLEYSLNGGQSSRRQMYHHPDVKSFSTGSVSPQANRNYLSTAPLPPFPAPQSFFGYDPSSSPYHHYYPTPYMIQYPRYEEFGHRRLQQSYHRVYSSFK